MRLLRHFFDPRGRVGVLTWWLVVVPSYIFVFVAAEVREFATKFDVFGYYFFVSMCVMVAYLFLVVVVKRCHDLGDSVLDFSFNPFGPIIGFIEMSFMKGQSGANQHGPPSEF